MEGVLKSEEKTRFIWKVVVEIATSHQAIPTNDAVKNAKSKTDSERANGKERNKNG